MKKYKSTLFNGIYVYICHRSRLALGPSTCHLEKSVLYCNTTCLSLYNILRTRKDKKMTPCSYFKIFFLPLGPTKQIINGKNNPLALLYDIKQLKPSRLGYQLSHTLKWCRQFRNSHFSFLFFSFQFHSLLFLAMPCEGLQGPCHGGGVCTSVLFNQNLHYYINNCLNKLIRIIKK